MTFVDLLEAAVVVAVVVAFAAPAVSDDEVAVVVDVLDVEVVVVFDPFSVVVYLVQLLD